MSRHKRPSEVKNAPPPPDQPDWAIEAKTAREAYLAELCQPNATHASVARKFGVTRQAVHQATVGYDKKRKTDRIIDRARKRTSGTRGPYTCRACGEVGHRQDNPDCKMFGKRPE